MAHRSVFGRNVAHDLGRCLNHDDGYFLAFADVPWGHLDGRGPASARRGRE